VDLGLGALATLFLILQYALFPIFVAPADQSLFAAAGKPAEGKHPVACQSQWHSRDQRLSGGRLAPVQAYFRQCFWLSLGTTRISLNDNLLKQSTPDEVLAVLGHEMGHYVMDHTTRLLLLLSLVYAGGFCLRPFRISGCWWISLAAFLETCAGLTIVAGLPAADGAGQRVFLPDDAGDQHHHPHHRTAGRHLRRGTPCANPMPSPPWR